MQTKNASMDQIGAWLEAHQVGAVTLVASVALVVVAAIVIALVNRLLKALLLPAGARIGWRSESIALTGRVVTLVLWFLVLLLLLQLWGVALAGFWALLASVATVIGVAFLATWAMISNVTASLILAIWHPFHIGDMVELLPENLKGRAVDRNLMFTALREETGAVIQVPNNLFFQKVFRVGSRARS